MPDTSQAHNATRPGGEKRLVNDLPGTRALQDNVRLKSYVCDAASVVGRAQSTYDLGLGARLGSVQNVNFQPELLAQHGAEQADRPRSRHQHGFRLPEGAPAHGKNMLPSLYNNRRRLKQHAEDRQRRINLDCVFGLDPSTLQHVTVDSLDAPLRILTVAACVPLAHRTVRAGDGIGAADDAHHQIALFQPACGSRVEHAAKRLMAEHEAGLAGGAQPYLPLAISISVRQTPTAITSTNTEPVWMSGSGTFSKRTDSCFPGSTVMAFISWSLSFFNYATCCNASSRRGRSPRRKIPRCPNWSIPAS